MFAGRAAIRFYYQPTRVQGLFHILQLFDFEVKEDYPVGVVFGAVTGDDNDIGSNAILFYHILGDGKKPYILVFCKHWGA